VHNLVRRIAARHEVAFVAPVRAPEDQEAISNLKGFCFRVETAPLRRQRALAHVPGLLRFGLKGWPLELKFLYAAELFNRITALASAVPFDVVHVEPSRMAFYLEAVPRGTHTKSILVFHNQSYHQFARIQRVTHQPLARLRALLYSRQMQGWEPLYAQRFDRCIVVSESERNMLLAANPRLKVDVIPNGVDTKTHQPMARENALPHLLFIGTMSYQPCVDGAAFLCGEILPRIRRMLSGVQVWIVGPDPVPEVVRLGGDGVHVTGRVADVAPYYRESAVSVVPLRAGGGTRLKILESMALGRPVVSTSIGCEGLDLVDGKHILVADEPERFAQSVVRLLTDEELYERMVVVARQLVVARYDWDALAGRLNQVYTELQQPRTEPWHSQPDVMR